ncbi:type II toxin-antitoxin system HicB family antitoxin [Exiguobacterium sp. UBA3968]|uniref:type II toxin-antitoxin system HicB family antitoxin n=1 Tax=Exiguobacterium sp. UBA3968 TaxID=1946492 RepID=UPI0025C3AB31|nr:type II toxin-antitoxin system HicB family antitoxin [Exiguobacterium sp. UBA3968]
MAIYKYYAVLTKIEEDEGFSDEGNDGYDVSFPDLNNVFTYGETYEHALFMAKDVLELMLESMLTHGETFNNPSTLQQLNLNDSKEVHVELIEVDVEPRPDSKLSTPDSYLLKYVDARNKDVEIGLDSKFLMESITRVLDAGGTIISLGDYDMDEDEVFYTGRVVK